MESKMPETLETSTSSIVRNTFGILDKETGKRYADIISSHLQLRRLSFDDWFIVGRIAESKDRNKEYKLLIDHALKKKLCQELVVDVLVSFQIRKDGCYAVARIFDVNKKGNQYASL
jgi:hypothetical protein